jgi:hypothetical protein
MLVRRPYGARVADRNVFQRLLLTAVVVTLGVVLTVTVAVLAPPAHGAATDVGTVRGVVRVPGIPPGTTTVRDVIACPAEEAFGFGCSGRQSAQADGDGAFSMDLAAGDWRLQGWYREIHSSGPPPVVGDPVRVSIEAGRVTTQDLVVDYRPSGIVEGRLTVRGLPTGADPNLGVFACRPDVPLAPFCSGGGSDLFFDEHYSLSLLAGDWRIVPAYNFQNNDVFGAPVDVHIDGGETRELDLAVDFDPTLPPAPPPRPICDGIVDGIFTSVPCGPSAPPTLPGPPATPPPAPPAVALVAPPGFVPRFTG